MTIVALASSCAFRLSRRSAVLAAALIGLSACVGRPCEGDEELIIDLDDAVVPATMDLRGIIRLDAGYLAVGTGGVIVRRMNYGDWVPIESPTDADLLAVGHWGPRLIAVGRGGAVVRSDDDGLSFTLVDLGLSEDLHAVMLDGQRGVIVGDDRIMYSSDGGEGWAQASLPAGSFGLRGVAGEGDTLWAAGLGGVLLRSDDEGASWSELAPAFGSDLWALGFAGADAGVGLFAVGDAGTILRLEAEGWAGVEHDLDGDFRGVGGNFIVGVDGLVVAIELEQERMVELGRDPSRGDLWDVVDEFAVGDNSRITTIQTDWVSHDPDPFCAPGA